MAINFSEGLAKSLVGDGTTDGSMKEAFQVATMDFYTGARPANANAAPTGTLVAQSDQIDLQNAVVGSGTDAGYVYSPETSVTATGLAAAGSSGQLIGWARLRLAGDSGALSTTDLRIDFTVGTTSGDVRIAGDSTLVVEGQVFSFTTLKIRLKLNG